MYQVFNTREDMIRSLVTKNGVYAELGVSAGNFSKKIYSILNPSQLVLIDLFHGVNGTGDKDGNNFTYVDLSLVYKGLLQDTRFTVRKGDTSTVLKSYSDKYFDMIYIDADHTYEGCKKDLEVSLHKVKPGGWIMGHDYELNMNKAKTKWDFGVKKAVDEFCHNHGLTVSAKGNDGCVSYAIRVPI